MNPRQRRTPPPGWPPASPTPATRPAPACTWRRLYGTAANGPAPDWPGYRQRAKDWREKGNALLLEPDRTPIKGQEAPRTWTVPSPGYRLPNYLLEPVTELDTLQRISEDSPDTAARKAAACGAGQSAYYTAKDESGRVPSPSWN